jgi:hypothetical protein
MIPFPVKPIWQVQMDDEPTVSVQSALTSQGPVEHNSLKTKYLELIMGSSKIAQIHMKYISVGSYSSLTIHVRGKLIMLS